MLLFNLCVCFYFFFFFFCFLFLSMFFVLFFVCFLDTCTFDALCWSVSRTKPTFRIDQSWPPGLTKANGLDWPKLRPGLHDLGTDQPAGSDWELLHDCAVCWMRDSGDVGRCRIPAQSSRPDMNCGHTGNDSWRGLLLLALLPQRPFVVFVVFVVVVTRVAWYRCCVFGHVEPPVIPFGLPYVSAF